MPSAFADPALQEQAQARIADAGVFLGFLYGCYKGSGNPRPVPSAFADPALQEQAQARARSAELGCMCCNNPLCCNSLQQEIVSQ